MDDIEQYLYENPELIEQFLNNNKTLLNEIKNRFDEMQASGDLIGRYLLSKALFEILRVTGEATKELLKQEMAKRGVNITGDGARC